eukprot:scpid58645/ scgid27213/ 
MADPSAGLQTRKRSTTSHFKTLAELEVDLNKAIGNAISETAITSARQVIMEFDQHLEESNESLDKYTEALLSFNPKKQDDKDMKQRELSDLADMEEDIRKWKKKISYTQKPKYTI